MHMKTIIPPLPQYEPFKFECLWMHLDAVGLPFGNYTGTTCKIVSKNCSQNDPKIGLCLVFVFQLCRLRCRSSPVPSSRTTRTKHSRPRTNQNAETTDEPTRRNHGQPKRKNHGGTETQKPRTDKSNKQSYKQSSKQSIKQSNTLSNEQSNKQSIEYLNRAF